MPFWITLSSVSAAQEHSQCCTQPSCETRHRLSCSIAQTKNQGGILCLNAAPEQSRGTCAKASHCFFFFLKLDTCSLSNLAWPKQPDPRDKGDPWQKERQRPQLLPSEKSVSCVRASQCLIMSWSFSATCAMKDTNLYLLLDLKQNTQLILSLAALPRWASSLSLELMCSGRGQKDGFYGYCLSINSFSLGDFYFHCPSIYAMQGIM